MQLEHRTPTRTLPFSAAAHCSSHPKRQPAPGLAICLLPAPPRPALFSPRRIAPHPIVSGSPPARHPRHRPTRLRPPPSPSGRACQGAHGRGAGLRAGRGAFRAILGAAGASRYRWGAGHRKRGLDTRPRAPCRRAPPSSGTARCFSAILGVARLGSSVARLTCSAYRAHLGCADSRK